MSTGHGMRVTHVITRLIVGGAQENTVASVLGLRSKPGLELTLISGPTTGPEGSLEPLLAPFPGLLLRVPQLIRPVRPLQDWTALRELTRIFLQTRPDIVHTHSGKAGVVGRLAAARAGVPLILHTIHGPSFGSFQGPLANAVFRYAERRAARVTDHFVVVAEAMRDQYLAAGIGTPNQYTRVFSGFHLEAFLKTGDPAALREQLGIASGEIVVGKIARLAELKGHEDLFAAAPALVQAFPKMKFLLVGDGPWRGRLEQRAEAAGLKKHFIFTGLLRPEEVPSYVGAMDVLVHLSRREGLPRALPQAMAGGRPVVAFDCDGAREVCLDGQTGFLLQPGDIEGLSRALLRLAREPALRQNLGANGREFVRGRFAVQTMVDELHSLYLRLSPDSQRTSAAALAS